MIAKASWISILMAAALCGGLWFWLQQTQLGQAIHIEAPREAEFSVPVYAQFTVSQSLSLPTLSKVVGLKLPIHMAAKPTGELIIDLRQNDVLLQRWRIDLSKSTGQPDQVVDLDLPLTPSRLLEGKLELSLAVPELDAHFPEMAPRVLVETADQGYPDGNYRIANNQKQGDIALTVVEQVTYVEVYQQLWQERALLIIQRIGQLLVVGLLLIALPGMLVQSWSKRPTS